MMDRMSRSSRRRLGLAAAVVLAALAASACKPAPQGPRKVTLAVGSQVLNSSYTYLVMPQALNYWRDEGLDVSVIPVGGSQQAIQQLMSGKVDLAEVNSGSLIQAVAGSGLPLRAVMTNTTLGDWSLVSLADGPVKSVKDFKGRTIGIATLGSGGVPMVKAYLKANGLDPDKDVTLQPTGSAGTALQALRSGRVDGLMYWGSAVLSLQMAGAKLNLFRPPEWSQFADFSVVARADSLQKDSAVAEAVVRGMAKASAFFAANPECARKVLWARTPELKASAGDDAAKADFDRRMIELGASQVTGARTLGDKGQWAAAPQAAYERVQQFMVDNGVIAKGAPGATLVLGDTGFYGRANRFDDRQIQQQATRCDGV